MNRNRSGSDLLVEKQSKSAKKVKRSKPSLPVRQKLSFSAGHFLNDAVNSAWSSYLIIFQTKVLGLSNSTTGLLWVIAAAVDSVLSLLVGYVCDNTKIPFLAKYYGQRKSFHLLGCTLVAGLFPFLMMPCLVCGETDPEWKLAMYYGSIKIFLNLGWCLSQVSHLALISEIAKRPSEMVELHAARSGVTFFSGIFMYAVTWVVLKTDGDQFISFSQWIDFMEMAVIVVGTGCLFALIFHLGTKEPPALQKNGNGPPGSFIARGRQRSRSATLPLAEQVVGIICLYDEHKLIDKTAQQSTNGDAMATIKEEEEEEAATELDNSNGNTELENGPTGNSFSFSNPGFLSEDKDTISRKDSSISEEGHTNRGRSQSERGSQTEIMDDRWSHRSDSSAFADAGYASTPETDSIASVECSEENQNSEKQCVINKSCEKTRPRSLSGRKNRAGSFTKGPERSYSGVSVIIEEVHEQKETRKPKQTWKDWFKKPMFYKISFAYMCIRLSQVITASYLPLYLIETLTFEKEAIAYFPLVILVSGVISSLGTKKMNKMLGAKWTYCLAAALVMGSGAWFYLQTESGKNASYCAAIIRGCGESVMYVTSLTLAGELIGDNKESGAFVFASMSLLSKLACGSAMFLSQEFFPTDGFRSEYLRYVFSIIPGASSLFGFMAVIAFLPATVRCRKIVHTVDSSAQTDDTIEEYYAYENQVAIEDHKEEKTQFEDIEKAPIVA